MFLSTEHRKQYEKFLVMDITAPDDRERKSMFYILAGNKDILSKGIDNFYSFEENMLKFSPDELEEVTGKLCSSSRALLMLACNLYNNSYPSLSFTDTFWNLDKNNYRLVMQALILRFEPEENWRKAEGEYAKK